MHMIMPEALINRGKQRAFPETSSLEVEEIIKQAQVLSAKEPNKSAPMPAISPTLSPTLSAMTPGFQILSSSSPAITFPTKSEPTSAALVYIPPLTLPNRAIVDPPSP